MSAYKDLSPEDKQDLADWAKNKVLGDYCSRLSLAQQLALQRQLNKTIQQFAGDALYDKVFEIIKDMTETREAMVVVAVATLMNLLLECHVTKYPTTTIAQALTFYESAVRRFFTDFPPTKPIRLPQSAQEPSTPAPRSTRGILSNSTVVS